MEQNKIYVKVATKSGIFRVRNPKGRMGVLHFAIVTKYMEGGEELTLDDKAAMEAGKTLPKKKMSPQARAMLAEALIEWTSKVLPNILVGFTPEGSTEENTTIKVDDLKGEDQAAIFYALLDGISISEDFFRVVE